MTRYPLRPLLSASGLSYDDARRRVGASGSDWARAMREGLSEAKADRWAVRLGRLAYEVWPEMVDDAIADLELQEADVVRRQREQNRRSWHRRWARMTPEQREAKREYGRQYRQRAKRAISVSRRRYYEEHREEELARQRDYDARRRREVQELIGQKDANREACTPDAASSSRVSAAETVTVDVQDRVA